MKKIMIYGGTEYTGRMVAVRAKMANATVVIAARSQAPLANLAAELGGDRCRVIQAKDPALDQNLSDISVLLNCAGPFLCTAKPLMDACLRIGVHYIDTAAELDSYRRAESLDNAAPAWPKATTRP